MDELPITISSFQEFLKKRKLMATRCDHCDALWLPPRPICPDCHGDKLKWTALSGHGTLLSFTVIHFGTMPMINEGHDVKKPYCAGIVETAEGPRISAQILGVDVFNPENIPIGSPVSFEFVKRESWHFVREVAEVKKPVVAFRIQS